MQWVTAQDLDVPSSAYAEEAVQAASYILWQLSGRKFSGVKTITEIYRQSSGNLSGQMTPVFTGSGDLVNRKCGSCGGIHTLWLRNRPVVSVTQLSVGGTVVPPSQYLLVDSNRLIPSSPGACWGGASTDLVVTYTYGAEPPAAGKLAARELANQIIYAATNDDRCRLPDRVTSVTRQGVSWTIIDPQDFLDKGRTGLYLVDLFLKTVNPTGSRVRSRVFSPDIPRPGKIKRPIGGSPTGTLTIAALKGEPFSVTLGYATSPGLLIQVTNHQGQSWEIPSRMITRINNTDPWNLVGVLASDTSLVPNKAIIDIYEVNGSTLTHLDTDTIVRTAQTAVT